MRVTPFHCGPAANESELKAFEYLKNRLQSEPGEDYWILLTNLTFSVTHQLQSDEIDIIVIGPAGVRVVEVKHWAFQWFDKHHREAANEADKLTIKARKIGTTLRRSVPELPHVHGAILLTQDRSKIKRLAGQKVRGVQFYTLNDWRAAIGLDDPRVLSPQQVKTLAGVLEPRTPVAIDGSIRRLAGYVNLELQTPKDQRFHRVYKGSHPTRRDRVILHLYDFSASDDINSQVKARREFEALHRLQIYSWAPRVLDSYQETPGYAGEMFFFTVVDPAAPCIEDRAKDDTWTSNERLQFARNTIQALTELQGGGTPDEQIIHRNLTPQTILCKHNNSPILTGFEHAKIPLEISVGSVNLPAGAYWETIAPEVKAQGLGVADYRSDLYSLCASLGLLFQGREDDISQRASEILSRGLAKKPEQRGTLEDLDVAISEVIGESVPLSPAPPARFWTEDQVIRFGNGDYRIVSRLGSGGVGTTFKVVQIDRSTKEDLGTYVAKVAHNHETGPHVLKAYTLARSHLPSHPALSNIFEVGNEWQENEFAALMTWIPGTPLIDFSGVFPLLAEEHQEPSAEALALGWLHVICEALDVLHRNGLVHGDVSPKNLIVSGSDLVLTDYDFVGKIGEPIAALGTVLYCSPSYTEGRFACAADDIFALASSFFHVVFEKVPFLYGGDLDKKRGLNWEGLNREEYPTFAAFLDKATHPDPSSRFASVGEALAAIKIQKFREGSIRVKKTDPEQPKATLGADQTQQSSPEQKLREQQVEWLLSLLQAYPGSRWGNRETRGLDTEFAGQTYVESGLEATLHRDIMERRVQLVILCGNAGDGKTALLQRLADRLGLGKHQSSERVLEGYVTNGTLIRINMDGSASWQGRSADDILDEFLSPFRDGPPSEDIVHMVAINDGRLLEWITGFEDRNGGMETRLIKELYDLLQDQPAAPNSHIRFINLNQRSLVGGITQDKMKIESRFLERLLNQLYGGEQAAKIWTPCQSCTAKGRCEVYRTVRIFGPDDLPDSAESSLRSHARARLFEALQAVHLRGETHITVRELRATLVYILFGVHFCDEYHAGSGPVAIPYWERAFSADSPERQGEVLSELALFDPALEAHPQIDRHLQSKLLDDADGTASNYPELPLESARRRAYFEWTPSEIKQIAGDQEALGLARGRHLRLFRDLPLDSDLQERASSRELLCAGIARLEDLPPQALDRPGVVPLRVTPRTPTETAFWVEKPLSAFRLDVELPSDAEGLERLHRQAILVYRYRDGSEERLWLGAELFHLLVELAEGYQLGDVSTDDTFAHLSIFVQRLVREDERQMLAWNPIQDEAIYEVSAPILWTESGPQQPMIITPIAGRDDT